MVLDDCEPEDDEEGGGECVICMSEPRDTLILPCRHLCLCQLCADSLRYQANNCPICRSPFRALLQIRALRKLQAPSPAEVCFINFFSVKSFYIKLIQSIAFNISSHTWMNAYLWAMRPFLFSKLLMDLQWHRDGPNNVGPLPVIPIRVKASVVFSRMA